MSDLLIKARKIGKIEREIFSPQESQVHQI